MELQRTGEKLLESIAYGDAAGVPVETKSFTYIENTYTRIGNLIPTKGNPYFKGEWPAGKTSDDIQLSVAMVRALIKADGFDLHAIAEEHIRAYNESPEHTLRDGRIKKLGWGGAIVESVQRLIQGVSPTESGAEGATGNEVIVKMAPLVYWQYVRCFSKKERYEQYDLLTNMTHDSDVARVATRVHGDVLYNLLLQDYNEAEFCNQTYTISLFHEQQLRYGRRDVSRGFDKIKSGRRLNHLEIRELYQSRAESMTDEEFGKSYGFYVPETLMISYAAFALGRGDYHRSVYTAVNIGGDADSTASIVGAMVNFDQNGEAELPKDSEKIQDIEKLRELSREFSRRALQLIL